MTLNAIVLRSMAGRCCKVLTPLIFTKINLLLQLQLIGIHLSIKAIVLLQHACQTSSACVDSTPVRNGLRSIDFGGNILKMTLAKLFNWNTLTSCELVHPVVGLSHTCKRSHNSTSPAVSSVNTLLRSFSNTCLMRPFCPSIE